MAASANASLPFINTLSVIGTRPPYKSQSPHPGKQARRTAPIHPLTGYRSGIVPSAVNLRAHNNDALGAERAAQLTALAFVAVELNLKFCHIFAPFGFAFIFRFLLATIDLKSLLS
jgi:hypothetical protein